MHITAEQTRNITAQQAHDLTKQVQQELLLDAAQRINPIIVKAILQGLFSVRISFPSEGWYWNQESYRNYFRSKGFKFEEIWGSDRTLGKQEVDISWNNIQQETDKETES